MLTFPHNIFHSVTFFYRFPKTLIEPSPPSSSFLNVLPNNSFFSQKKKTDLSVKVSYKFSISYLTLLKLYALSEKIILVSSHIILQFPLLAINHLKATKKVSMVILFTNSRCSGLVTPHVNKFP